MKIILPTEWSFLITGFSKVPSFRTGAHFGTILLDSDE
jgi:hypothetical protein